MLVFALMLVRENNTFYVNISRLGILMFILIF